MAAGELESVQPTPQTEMDALLLGRTKELAAVVEGDGRNWRGIGISVLVIIVICGIIATAIFSLSPELRNFRKRPKRSELDIVELLSGAFYPRQFNGTWLSSDELMFRDENDNLVVWDVNQNISTRKTLVSNTLFHIHYIQDYTMSADRSYLLLTQDIQKIFRYSYTAHLKLYRIDDEELIPLSSSIKNPSQRLDYASWGPRGTQLVFVYDSNIYYKKSASDPPVQLTKDGNITIVYNGVPDWLYEEEILQSNSAIWWSPNGVRLCYGHFNDSGVDTMDYQVYDDLYPRTFGLRYPRPGRTNPVVDLRITELDGEDFKTVTVRPPREIEQVEHYFTGIKWIDDDNISVIWTKRAQNYSVLSLCSRKDEWICRTILPISNNGRGWVETRGTPFFDSSKENYFFILPSFQSAKDGHFQHIIKLPVNSHKGEFLTSGLYEVTEILSYDEKSKLLYYRATLPGKPGERHIFQMQLDSKSTTCLSCDLGSECLFNSAVFSPENQFYALDCQGPGVPLVEIRNAASNELVATIQTNDAVREKLDNLLLPKVKDLTVPIEGGYDARIRLYLPPSLKEDEVTKYPLLINVYAGPGSQQVSERFQINWGTYLSTRRGIIYGMIDGRGSGFNGDKLLHELYRKLGSVEIDDQIAVTRYLKNKFSFIDSKKIGIWGWSYGGYVTSMILATEQNAPHQPEPVFSCGIAIAPVTSWSYYDSTYTERYMGFPTPQDNLVGYKQSEIFLKVLNFKGKNFLLIHGTADDNVHVQQSMLLMKMLQRNNILFKSQIYPDQNHELPHVTRHLYRTMEATLKDCFDLDTVYEEIGLQRRRIIRKTEE